MKCVATLSNNMTQTQLRNFKTLLDLFVKEEAEGRAEKTLDLTAFNLKDLRDAIVDKMDD